MWVFLNPFFLWAMSAALIPLVLHLMQRRRVVKIPFSTIRFLKLAQQKSSNRIRLENFLLWLLRTLTLLFIALAFSLPILRITSFRQLMGSSRRDVAIVMDVSYSMDYVSGKKKVWDTAKNCAISIIESLSHGDRVCIFLADDDVTPLIEQPTKDFEMALAQVKAMDIQTTASQLKPAVVAACTALKESGGREREVFIITDGQKLPWEKFQKSTQAIAEPETAEESVSTNSSAHSQWNAKIMYPNTTFFVVATGVTAPENSAPMSIEIQPKLLMAGTSARLSVQVSHTGRPQSISTALVIDEMEISRRSMVVEEGTANNVIFPLPSLPKGIHTAKIETSSDGLIIDNIFYFLLHIREKIPVLCVGTKKDMFYLIHALNPGGSLSAIEMKRVDTDNLGENVNPNTYSCVFLCNVVPLPGQSLVALEHYVRQGGLLVLFPGDRGNPADYESWSCLPALPRVIKDIQPDDQRQLLRLVKPGDPIFTGMQLPPGAIPTITVKREIQWNKLEATAEPIIKMSNENPFLLRHKVGKGQMLCFSVSADRRWSNLPLSPFFLPIIHQIVQFGASAGKEPLFIWTSRNLNISNLLPVRPGTVELFGPSDESITIEQLKSGNEITLNVENISIPGIYYLSNSESPSPKPFMAVNVMRNESDLSLVDLQKIPSLIGSKKIMVAENKETLLQLVKKHRVGRPLAEQLLWLAFILGIFELFVANKTSQKTRTLSEQLVIEPTGRVHGKATG